MPDNNIVEQDHRTIKKRIRPMLGFKSFGSASATLKGIEVANMIRKGYLTPGLCPIVQFAALAAESKEIVALHPAVSEICNRAVKTALSSPTNS